MVVSTGLTVFTLIIQQVQVSLAMCTRLGPKKMHTYNDFVYRKTKDDSLLKDRFDSRKMPDSHPHTRDEFADKQTAYNEGSLYNKLYFHCQ